MEARHKRGANQQPSDSMFLQLQFADEPYRDNSRTFQQNGTPAWNEQDDTKSKSLNY